MSLVILQDLTPENTVELLEKFKRGEDPKKGPQIDRNHSEGPLGRTSLFKPEEIGGVHDRDFVADKQQWEEARAKAAAAAKK